MTQAFRGYQYCVEDERVEEARAQLLGVLPSTNDYNYTLRVLIMALEMRDNDVLRWLIQHKTLSLDLRYFTEAQVSSCVNRVVSEVVSSGRVDVVEWLLKQGTVFGDKDINSMLSQAAEEDERLGIIEKVLEVRPDSKVGDALAAAVRKNRRESARLLLRADGVSDTDAEEALCVAACADEPNLDIIKDVLEAKPGCSKDRAVVNAAMCNNLEVMEMLLDAEQNPGVANAYDSLALLRAVEGWNGGPAKRLLNDEKNPADPYKRNTLVTAVLDGDLGMLEMLLENSTNDADKVERGPALAAALAEANADGSTEMAQIGS